MDSISVLIDQIGFFALGVVAVWVAIMIVVSMVDRHPGRDDPRHDEPGRKPPEGSHRDPQ